MARIIGLLILISMSLGCQPSPKTNPLVNLADQQEQPGNPQQVEPFFSGQRHYENLKPAAIPDVVLERHKQVQKRPVNESKSTVVECLPHGPFQVYNPNLEINVDRETMTFQADLEAKNQRESLKFQGSFQKKSPLWRSELYSVDEKVLKEKRVQVVALCLTAHRCDEIGVNIYYVLDGKVHCRQLITGVEDARIADSGHNEVSSELDPDWIVPESIPEPKAELKPDPNSTAADQAGIKVDENKPNQSSKVDNVKPSNNGNVSQPVKKPVGLKNLSSEELKDAVIEYSGGVIMAPPSKNQYRIELIPETPKDSKGKSSNYNIQAVKWHNNGYLRNATYIPPKGVGFVRRAYLQNPNVTQEKDSSNAWGTEMMREFIEKVGSAAALIDPDQPVVFTNISTRMGGPLRGHQSHHTGLDADFRLLYDRPKTEGFHFIQNGRLVPELNIAKNWLLVKAMVSAAQKEWLMVIWTDDAVKQALCEHAKKLGEPIDDKDSLAYKTLKVIRHWSVHTNVAHVRLYCPSQSEGCMNKFVSIPENNGCRVAKR
jgi:murein endopeptidase